MGHHLVWCSLFLVHNLYPEKKHAEPERFLKNTSAKQTMLIMYAYVSIYIYTLVIGKLGGGRLNGARQHGKSVLDMLLLFWTFWVPLCPSHGSTFSDIFPIPIFVETHHSQTQPLPRPVPASFIKCPKSHLGLKKVHDFFLNCGLMDWHYAKGPSTVVKESGSHNGFLQTSWINYVYSLW